MDVETPNVSATTNDERTPLIDRTPRARVTKPAAWVWAIVMLTCLAGVIFLGVSGNLHQDMGVSGNDNDMDVSGNLNDAAAVHAAGDSSDIGWGWSWKKAFKGVQGKVKNLKKALKDAEIEAAFQKNHAATLATEVASLKTQLETQTNYAASRANQITDLNKVMNAVKNMHKLSDLQNNAIIPAEIKSAVSTMVDSIHGVKRDVVDSDGNVDGDGNADGDGNVDGDGNAASDVDTDGDGDGNGDGASGPGPACNDTKADAANKAKEIVQLKHQITDFTHVINTVKNMHYLSDLHRNAIIPAEIKIEVSKMMDSMHDRDPWSQRSPPPAPAWPPAPPSLPEC